MSRTLHYYNHSIPGQAGIDHLNPDGWAPWEGSDLIDDQAAAVKELKRRQMAQIRRIYRKRRSLNKQAAGHLRFAGELIAQFTAAGYAVGVDAGRLPDPLYGRPPAPVPSLYIIARNDAGRSVKVRIADHSQPRNRGGYSDCGLPHPPSDLSIVHRQLDVVYRDKNATPFPNGKRFRLVRNAQLSRTERQVKTTLADWIAGRKISWVMPEFVDQWGEVTWNHTAEVGEQHNVAVDGNALRGFGFLNSPNLYFTSLKNIADCYRRAEEAS